MHVEVIFIESLFSEISQSEWLILSTVLQSRLLRLKLETIGGELFTARQFTDTVDVINKGAPSVSCVRLLYWIQLTW